MRSKVLSSESHGQPLRFVRASRPVILVTLVAAVLLLVLAAPASASGAAASKAGGAASKAGTAASSSARADLLKGSRATTQNGWLLVHLEGTPYQIGYQRGYLTGKLAQQWVRSYLGPRGSAYRVGERSLAKRFVWPKVPTEYRQELRGNVAGMRARGYKVDIWDLVAANAWADTYVYEPLLARSTSGRCSAFVATGQATADGGIVMAHNTWSNYDGDFMYRIMFDVKPATGHAFRYQGSGGSIWSGEDWYVNDTGLMVCETSLDNSATNPKGVPVFVRIRQAVQYGTSIDDVVRILLRRNNGGYPNEWLMGDAKTNEIASLQLGARAWDLKRTTSGFYASSNWPTGIGFRSEAHSPKPSLKYGSYARLVRWGQLEQQWNGKIDAGLGQTMLSDHWDTYLNREAASSRTLCGHCESETVNKDAMVPEGAYDGKVMTSAMALNGMQMLARWGHPCGAGFDAQQFMQTHPKWTKQADWFARAALRTFDADTPNAWTLVGAF